MGICSDHRELFYSLEKPSISNGSKQFERLNFDSHQFFFQFVDFARMKQPTVQQVLLPIKDSDQYHLDLRNLEPHICLLLSFQGVDQFRKLLGRIAVEDFTATQYETHHFYQPRHRVISQQSVVLNEC